jgi:hypothetical protein
MELPSVEDVRKRIWNVDEESIRYCLMTAYLFDGRISEVVGRKSPSDESVAGGPKGSDARLDTCRVLDREIEAVVFTVKTSKRQGRERLIGLPLEECYEPWSKWLYAYFQKARDRFVFPFTRKYVWKHITDAKVFEGLRYPIEKYKVNKKGEIELVQAHERDFKLHALRHLRATELVGSYGFDGFNLATYGGWTYHRMAETSSMMDRYLSLSWQSYFGKLLKKRTL